MSKPQNKVKIDWTPDFAYAIGALVTDGCLSKDGRHITLVSKDRDFLELIQSIFRTDVTIGRTSSGSVQEKRYFRIQIGDVNFYHFLESIGLMPNKSKIIGDVDVPDEYFGDFLRGHFDGDGCFYSYFDKRWKSSFMYYVVFNSASPNHIAWLQKKIQNLFGVKGHVTKSSGCLQLKYAKRESDILIEKMYPGPGVSCLERKLLKIFQAMFTMRARARVEKLVNSPA